LNNWDDYENDAEVGFHISHAGDIDEEEVGGYKGIVKKIKEVVGNNAVYSEPGNMQSSEDELTADSHLGHRCTRPRCGSCVSDPFEWHMPVAHYAQDWNVRRSVLCITILSLTVAYH
jgi:hypothetical protein